MLLANTYISLAGRERSPSLVPICFTLVTYKHYTFQAIITGPHRHLWLLPVKIVTIYKYTTILLTKG